LKKTIGANTTKLTLKDAVANDRYRKATWVNIGYIIFHELTGINVIMLYSHQMLVEMQGKSSPFTPKQGTYLVGVINMFSSLISTQTVKFFGRRTLVVWGHMFIAIIHCSIGLLNNAGNDIGVLVMLLMFLFVYQNTSGPVAWLYAAETTIDAALGICLLTLWGTVFILSLVCPILMSDPKDGGLGQSNVFFMLSGLAVLGSLYSYFALVETRGLSDKEKKLIFTPEKYKVEEPMSNQIE